MSAHKPKFNLEKVYLWQTIWSVFTNTGFSIALTEWLEQVEIKTQLSRYFTPQTPNGQALATETSFNNCLLWIQKLLQELKKSNYKLVPEWNYLGKTEEKNRYLNYVNQIFWQYQTDWLEHATTNLADLLENSWRLLELNHGLPISPAISFLSDKSQTFLKQITNQLTQWEFNNYLINDAEGNFHWRIEIDKQIRLLGWVFWQDGKFIHKIRWQEL